MRVKAGIAALFVALTIGASMQSSGQEGFYQGLHYRANDPFLFCTKGQDPQLNPAPCWKPLPPYTGNYMMMPYCRPPNPYGKQWTQDDIASLREYLTVCPQAMTSGRWQNGEGGLPESTPFQH